MNKSKKEPKEEIVKAEPSKVFFIDMLTRDIELKDAILDLLDNSVDGIIRLRDEKGLTTSPNPLDGNLPYKGYHAEITITDKSLKIEDNCGGISREDAKKHSFKLGSTDIKADKQLPTVGIYGIGMKRAIFKLGRACDVTIHHKKDAFKIPIPKSWFSSPRWNLTLEGITRQKSEDGTTIEITTLNDQIKQFFAEENIPNFIDDLSRKIATDYAYILSRGFEVSINDKKVSPKPLNFQFITGKDLKEVLPSNGKSKNAELMPFIYEGKYDDVEIRLVVGIYRDLLSDQDIEKESKSKSDRPDYSGWTVICNDRVILLGDKTSDTGWGDGNVPKYHIQYSPIAGVVYFQSNDVLKLPVRTTKRGLNEDSEVYRFVRTLMQEGTLHFTRYTSKWKKPSDERKQIARTAKVIDFFKVSSLVVSDRWLSVEKSKFKGRQFVPVLPAPPKKESNPTIRFSRPQKSIDLVSMYLYTDTDRSANVIGGECFDRMLARAKREGVEL